MNDPDSKKQQMPSAMSIIADAAANSQSIPFHNPMQKIPNRVSTNSIFERGNSLSRQIDPLKKRRGGTGSVVVNASDMDASSKVALTRLSKTENALVLPYQQQPIKPIASSVKVSSLDMLSTSTSSNPLAPVLLDQISTAKTTFIGNATIATPETPIGQVVESGQEQTGRWTREEHEAFLSALQKYGKEWKKVAARVKTRTVVQTRTHAQKYFQKLQKAMSNGNNDMNSNAIDAMMMMSKDDENGENALSTLSKKKSTPQKPPNRRNGLPSLTKLMREQEQAEATAAAAQLMAQMSSNMVMQSKKSQPQSYSYSEPSSLAPMYSFTNGTSNIKISAPSHEQVNDRVTKYGYPEPSPAACGKRKLAEIAAAQMLAGVAASSNIINSAAVNNSSSSLQFYKGIKNSGQAMDNSTSLQIVNPESLPVENGKKRQRWAIQNSPSTPWEDQLEALVSQFRNKENRSHSESSSSTASSVTEFMDVLPPLQPQPSHSALHTAVISSDVNQVSQLLKLIVSSSSDSLKPNLNGYTPLHSATCLKTNSLEITRLILSVGADVMETDRNGNTALHWAVRGGNADVAHVLVIRNCLLDSSNNLGETPLHWGMRSGPAGAALVRTLLADGAKPLIYSKSFQRPVDVAAQGFSLMPKASNLKDIIATRKNFFLNSSQSRTLVLHHPDCLEHVPKCEQDWEVPDRVECILKSIDGEEGNLIFSREIMISSEFERANLEFLSRVHSAEYLAFINDLSKELESRGTSNDQNGEKKQSVIPFTPVVQRTMLKDDNVEIGTHSDTSFGSGSLKAARRAAGAVQHSVDRVLMGRNSNAFCVVRPPGHHAGFNGLLKDSESSGFCIFNNIAAGAMHALSDRHRIRCERCAILDIDIHHGNGTEDIVRKINDPDRILFFSLHLFDHEPHHNKKPKLDWKFYPGSGEENDIATNIINVPIAPLWREEQFDESFSQNKYNTRNNKKHKSRENHDESRREDMTEVESNSFSKVSSLDDGVSSTQSQDLIGRGRQAYRNAIQYRLLPALRAFNPDLILMSTGFDAAKEDVGNAKHLAGGKLKMGIDLEPEDYAWTTRKIMEVAAICCQGRVVSVLEGGYGRIPTNEDENLLDKSIFSECAAMHLNALIDPHNFENRKPRQNENSSTDSI